MSYSLATDKLATYKDFSNYEGWGAYEGQGAKGTIVPIEAADLNEKKSFTSRFLQVVKSTYNAVKIFFQEICRKIGSFFSQKKQTETLSHKSLERPRLSRGEGGNLEESARNFSRNSIKDITPINDSVIHPTRERPVQDLEAQPIDKSTNNVGPQVGSQEGPTQLSNHDYLQAGSNLVQWSLIGAGMYGLAPTIIVPASFIAGLGSEIASFCLLPKDAHWFRKMLSIPVLSSALIRYNPWIGKLFGAVSFYNSSSYSMKKIWQTWNEYTKNPYEATKVGIVHLFNLISGTTFAADKAGLISLPKGPPKGPPKKCEPGSKEVCKREITAGSSHTNGGDERRNRYAEVIDSNHKKYANRWGLKHKVSTDQTLLKEQCKAIDGSAKDCSNYWLKIPAMKKWLEEPKNPDVDEEWRILIDDDMPVTNMTIDPNRAIDQLRGDTDSSVILVKDPNFWPAWYSSAFGNRLPNKNVAINGGLWFIRKDAKANDFMNKVWSTRNHIHDPNNKYCPTLGLCVNQDALHEQQGTAMVLHRFPGFLNKGIVSVVEARDTNSKTRSHIALNTYYGHDNECYLRIRDGWPSAPYIHSLKSNPDTSWQKGDWMGQIPAIPVWGKQLPVSGQGCNDDANIPPSEVRYDKIQEVISQIIE